MRGAWCVMRGAWSELGVRSAPRATHHSLLGGLGSQGTGARPREGEVKRGALPDLGLDPHPPAMRLDDLLADGQSRSCPLVLVAPMQPAEDAEDLLVIAWI